MNSIETTLVAFSMKRELNFKTIKMDRIYITWIRQVMDLGLAMINKYICNINVKEIINKATKALIICMIIFLTP